MDHPQWPFPTFLQVRDDLVMEELTQGIQPGSTSTLGSLSAPKTALAATPPLHPSAPPPSSLLGPPLPGPRGGGGSWRPSSPQRGRGAGPGRGSNPAPAPPRGAP